MKWEYLSVVIYKTYMNFSVDVHAVEAKAALKLPDDSVFLIPESRFLDTHTLRNDLGQFGWEWIKDEPALDGFASIWTFKRSVHDENKIYFDSSFGKKWNLITHFKK